ncbi:SLBB domain-containing protein [Paludibacterium paludis]|uniref:Polysaccharide export outer membrane protein n=1 Tax=Paludibacterium paludis TaxID=1225769 RepID=A0A918P4D7_9NEIS|nr:SLBB domain-containing protein [Paludibacterium paludis]GGY19232.1 hypothetical protein GCM10011289_23410 [Paludibacterium paludis]
MMKRLLIGLVCLFCGLAHAENAGEYHLGPGDVIKITVYDHADLANEVQLTRDGDITFPLIGTFSLKGQSTAQAEQTIASKLANGGFIVNPQVNVIMSQYRSQRLSVLGEVNRPGRFSLDSATDLVDVLSQAGGIAVTGGDKIVVIRGEQRTEYNLSELMNEKDPSRRIVKVSNGDVVFVPRQQVYVQGEVNRPGVFRLENNMTVLQAIAAAGGFNPRASHRFIYVHRADADGKVREQRVTYTDRVREGDVVYVEESWF